ncbi:MAG: lipoprotein-releasing ABC transporter permease subunit, partial [Gammaproteobacteria bacterium]|nr:lipoprotein-releasing ABC transporter permease subunit [Gammaproteobacteria bacterium]
MSPNINNNRHQSGRPWLSWWIGWRYARPQRRRGYVSFLSAMAIVGVMLSVASLIVVLSAVRGFELSLRERILDVVPHAQVLGVEGPLQQSAQVIGQAELHPEVLASASYIEAEGFLIGPNDLVAVVVNGIDPVQQQQVANYDNFSNPPALTSLAAGEFAVVIGQRLAELLGVSVGDTVNLVVGQINVGPFGATPRQRQFVVRDVFNAGMYEFDRGVVFVHQQDAAVLYRMADQVSGVNLRMRDPELAATVVREVARKSGGPVLVTDWTRKHQNFFAALSVTENVMVVILLVILFVAVFNVFASLMMLVRDKRRDVAILRAMGMSKWQVLRVFLVDGLGLGVSGAVLGVILGVALSLSFDHIIYGLELLFHTALVDPSVYFIDRFPAVLYWHEILVIAVGAVLLTAVAAMYPGWRASRVN